MNKINWTVVVIAALVVLLGVSLLGGQGYSGWGMMGPGMMGGWGFAPFGWIGMIFMWLIPIGFLVLTVLGIAWLARTLGSVDNPPAPAKTCLSCGRGVQADWRNCPHCGTTLTSP
jgi:uncharacterized membrane protein